MIFLGFAVGAMTVMRFIRGGVKLKQQWLALSLFVNPCYYNFRKSIQADQQIKRNRLPKTTIQVNASFSYSRPKL